MRNLIFEFIRKGHNRKVGIFVAGLDAEDKIIIGYSVFHKDAEEAIGNKFSKEKGLEIAIGRAEKHKNDFSDCPNSIHKDIVNFLSRCKRYYKNKDFAMSDNARRIIEAMDWFNEVNNTVPKLPETSANNDKCTCSSCTFQDQKETK